MGHLTFVPKRLSAVGNKRISQFFDSASEPRSRVIVLVDSTWVFLLLSFYIVIYSCFDKGCPTKALKRTRQCRLVLWVERVWR